MRIHRGTQIEFTMSDHFKQPMIGKVTAWGKLLPFSQRKVWVKPEKMDREICISSYNIRKIFVTR